MQFPLTEEMYNENPSEEMRMWLDAIGGYINDALRQGVRDMAVKVRKGGVVHG